MHQLSQQPITKEKTFIQTALQTQTMAIQVSRKQSRSKNSTAQSNDKGRNQPCQDLFEKCFSPSEIKTQEKTHSLSKISTYLKHNGQNYGSNLDAADLKSSKYPSTLDQSHFADQTEFSDISIGEKNGQSQAKSKVKQRLEAQLDSILATYSKKLQQSKTQFYQENLTQKYQLDKLRKIVDKNNTELRKKQMIIEDLEMKLRKQCKNNAEKWQNYAKQIDSFKQYYEQCFDYTLKRVSDIQLMLESLSKEITILETDENGILDKIKKIRESTVNIVGNCLLRTEVYKFESLQRISELMESTDNLKNQIKQINKNSRLVQDYMIKKQAFYQHIDFLKETLCSWQVQKSVNTETLFDMQLLQKSIIHEEQSAYQSSRNYLKRHSSINGKHNSLKNIEKKVEEVNLKMIKIEGSLKAIESQKQIQIQQSNKFKKSDNKIDDRNKQKNNEPKSLKIIEQNKIRQLKKQLDSYSKKLNQKNKLIYQLQLQINSHNMTIRDLKQQNQSNQSKIQELNKVVEIIEKQLQEQRIIQNGYLRNKQSNHFIRMEGGHSSVISFGVGSPMKGEFKPQSPTYSCNTEVIDQQVEEDLENTVQQVQYGHKFSKNNKGLQIPRHNHDDVQRLKQLNQALSLQLNQLRAQNEDLSVRIDSLIKQNQGLNHDYQNHVSKFEQQSSAFQKMLKVLRKQNKSIYQQRQGLYQEIQALKRRQIRSNSNNRIANSRERDYVRPPYQQNNNNQKTYQQTNNQHYKKVYAQQPNNVKISSNRPLLYTQDYRANLQDQSRSYQQKQKKNSQLVVHYTSKGSLQKRKERLLAQKNQLLNISRESDEKDSSSKNIEHYRQNYRRLTEQMATNTRTQHNSRGKVNDLAKCDSNKRISNNPKRGKIQASRGYELENLNSSMQDHDRVYHQETSRSFQHNLVSKDINNIKEALQFLQFSLPTPCTVDESGYLKHAFKGTYIMNRKGTLFRLTYDSLLEAQKNGILQLVQ